jgi:hypothetical protein
MRSTNAAEEESDDDNDFDWSGPDPEEKAEEQRVLVASFETLKKAEDDTKETLRQRLLKDAAAHRAMATARHME